jgi:hypothetical protein
MISRIVPKLMSCPLIFLCQAPSEPVRNVQHGAHSKRVQSESDAVCALSHQGFSAEVWATKKWRDDARSTAAGELVRFSEPVYVA